MNRLFLRVSRRDVREHVPEENSQGSHTVLFMTAQTDRSEQKKTEMSSDGTINV